MPPIAMYVCPFIVISPAVLFVLRQVNVNRTQKPAELFVRGRKRKSQGQKWQVGHWEVETGEKRSIM